MALTVYNGGAGTQGFTPNTTPTNLQGGTGIAQPTYQVQPATNVMNYGGTAPIAQPSGGGGGGGQTAVAVDPWASTPWGSQAAYNAATGQIDTGLNSIRAAGSEAFAGSLPTLQSQAENLANTIRYGQQDLTNARANTEYNRQSGLQDILGYVRQGMAQGASRLSNQNALDSSAPMAEAMAYNRLGNQKARSVNNQAGLQSAQQDITQSRLRDSEAQAPIQIQRMRDAEVNRIGSQVRSDLANLDMRAQSLNLPGRISVDPEKQRIIDAGQAQLQQVDQWLQGQLAGIQAPSQDQILQQAGALKTAGTALANPFVTGPLEQQQNVDQPAIDQLPLFVRPRRVTG